MNRSTQDRLKGCQISWSRTLIHIGLAHFIHGRCRLGWQGCIDHDRHRQGAAPSSCSSHFPHIQSGEPPPCDDCPLRRLGAPHVSVPPTSRCPPLGASHDEVVGGNQGLVRKIVVTVRLMSLHRPNPIDDNTQPACRIFIQIEFSLVSLVHGYSCVVFVLSQAQQTHTANVVPV